MTNRFEGKVAVVTGASRGIGLGALVLAAALLARRYRIAAWAAIPAAFAGCQLARHFLELLRHHQASG